MSGADPPIDPGAFFAPTPGPRGPRLALVFGNHAPGGACPWFAAGGCHHCDLGAGEGAAFDEAAQRRRRVRFEEVYAGVLPSVAHLLLYNSGSVLSATELPRPVLEELIDWAAGLPALRVLSLESREAFIDRQTVSALALRLGAGRTLRVVLGVESADDRIRDGLLEKRMPRAAILRGLDELAGTNAAVGGGRVGLEVNLLVGGPGAGGLAAVEDAAATARFALQESSARGLSVDLNLHPYHPSARGRRRFPAHPRCPPFTLVEATVAVDEVRRLLGAASTLFVGLEDEGRDQEPELRAAELAALRTGVERFNLTQDPGCLDFTEAASRSSPGRSPPAPRSPPRKAGS